MSRKLILISLVALVAIAGIWYVVLWSPQGASLKKAQASAVSSHEKEVTLKGQVAALQAQRAQLPGLQAKLAQLNEAVPTAPGIDKVIDSVNAVALASGVTLKSMAPPVLAPAAPGGVAVPGAVAMSLGVGVTGTYYQLVDFINRLNTMPRLAVVDGFSLATPDKSDKITTSITARVFVAPPPAPPAAKTTTTAKGTP